MILIRQLIWCAISVAANYMAASRAKSKKDFSYKINITEEEADESYFWLELFAGAGIIKMGKLLLLIK